MVACLLFVLVVSSLTFTLIPFASSQAADLKILSYSHYIDNLGNLVIVGEVQNTGNNIFGNVSIVGTVTTADGSQIDSGCLIPAKNLLPGQKSSFYMEFFSQSGTGSISWYSTEIANIDLRIYSAPTTNQYQYQDVVVITHKPTLIDGVYWVNCTLQNNGTQTATKIMVYGTFYNSSGQVVATGDIVYPVASLAPGATIAVNVPAFDLNQTLLSSAQKISGYSLLVQVQSPLLSADNGNAPTINPSSTPFVGDNPTISSGDSTMLYAAVIVIVAVVAVVCLVLILRRRKPKIAVVESKPAQPVKPRRTSRRERK